MSRQTNSSVMTVEALDSLKVSMTSVDVRRLVRFTRNVATRTAMVKLLRRLVVQYRIDPLQLLEEKGIGMMTLLSIQKLSELIAAQEVRIEFGIEDNLQALQTILQTFNRGVPDKVKVEIEKAKNAVTRARNIIEHENIETHLKKDIKAIGIAKASNIEGNNRE